MPNRCLVLCLLAALCCLGAAARDLELASPFTDHAVLQRGRAVPVWGWADPGATVRVSFAGHTVETVVDAAGRWRADLPAMAASAEPRVLRATAGDAAAECADVLVGEVWIASGQSNMEMPVAPEGRVFPGVVDWQAEVAAATYPQLRMFTVAKVPSQEPRERCEGAWQVGGPETVGKWAAVGYFFARDVHRRLGVPVGILHTSWGGSGSAAWIPRDRMAADPFLAAMLAQWDNWTDTYPKRYAEWEAQPKDDRKPRPPHGAPDSNQRPANLWCGMVAPLVPCAVRGTLWYQGETPGLGSYGHVYETLLRLQIAEWRARFENPDMTYLVVQLTNWRPPLAEPADAVVSWSAGWAWVRDAQLGVARDTPGVGMAVGIDLGAEDQLHPVRKQEVGARLELAAAALTYGRDVVWSGPWYRECRIEGAAIRCFFDHQDGGLVAADGGPLRRFAICGADRKFVWAEATIDTVGNEDTVLVRAPGIAEPVAVRYAFEMNPVDANLGNGAGLPASPFRTDDWQTEGEQRHRQRMETAK